MLVPFRGLSPLLSVQRCEVEDGEGQLRVHLHRVRHDGAAQLIAELRKQLPDCRISYVSAASLL